MINNYSPKVTEGEVNINQQYSPQGPEEMCLSLEHQNPSKTSQKMGCLGPDRVTFSLHGRYVV